MERKREIEEKKEIKNNHLGESNKLE